MLSRWIGILVISGVLIGAVASVKADGTHPRGVELDGTIGNSGKLSLPGPEYNIKAEYGKQAGIETPYNNTLLSLVKAIEP